MRSQDRARRDTELSRRPMTGQPTLHNRPHNAREDPSNKASPSRPASCPGRNVESEQTRFGNRPPIPPYVIPL